jgi:phosphatidate cytidylyltransferase
MKLPQISDELKLRVISGVVMFSCAVFIVSIGGSFYILALMLIALFCAAEFFLIIGKDENLQEDQIKKWIYIGVFSIGIPAISLYIIRNIFANGIIITFWFFIMVAMFDTFAYFSGKILGRTKLMPSVSPSKTWEGFIGGVVLSSSFSLIFYYAFHSKLNIWIYAVLSVIIAVLGQASDLTESYFKRKFNVKDSSKLIPGHGGFLDRFDGYLLTAPALVIFYFTCKAIFGIEIF